VAGEPARAHAPVVDDHAAIAVGISAGVALFVNRSLKAPPAASGPATRQP
jgi:hypothetical protein